MSLFLQLRTEKRFPSMNTYWLLCIETHSMNVAVPSAIAKSLPAKFV